MVSSRSEGTVLLQNHVGESTTDSPATSQPGSPKQGAVGRRLENLVFETGSQQTNGTSGPTSPRTPGIISPPPMSGRSRHNKLASNNNTPTTPTTPSIPQQHNPPVKSLSMDEELASVFMSPNVAPNSPLQQDSFFSNHVFDPFAQLSTPSKPATASDPFGMPSFTPDKPGGQGFEADKDYMDLQAGFSQGLSFGTEEFGMDSSMTFQ